MLGPVPRPLPLATMSESPRTASAAGYHSVGMRPTSESLPLAEGTPDVRAESSKTATALLSASATNRRLPPAESARAFGVLPSCGPAGGGSINVATTRPSRVSTATTRSVLPEATKRRDPSALSTIAEGCRPTVHRPRLSRRPSLPFRKADTVVPPHAETYTSPAPDTTTP